MPIVVVIAVGTVVLVSSGLAMGGTYLMAVVAAEYMRLEKLKYCDTMDGLICLHLRDQVIDTLAGVVMIVHGVVVDAGGGGWHRQ